MTEGVIPSALCLHMVSLTNDSPFSSLHNTYLNAASVYAFLLQVIDGVILLALCALGAPVVSRPAQYLNLRRCEPVVVMAFPGRLSA